MGNMFSRARDEELKNKLEIQKLQQEVSKSTGEETPAGQTPGIKELLATDQAVGKNYDSRIQQLFNSSIPQAQATATAQDIALNGAPAGSPNFIPPRPAPTAPDLNMGLSIGDNQKLATIAGTQAEAPLRAAEAAAIPQRADEKKAEFEFRKQMLQANQDQKDANKQMRDDQQQDKIEQNAMTRVAGVRGDASLKRIEDQRDAAITAYNTIDSVEKQGKVLNPIDMVDTLGQLWKARTGSVPTNEVLQKAYQDTLAGSGAKWWTYFTGKQMPGTTQDIMNSLKEMTLRMGNQADQQHDAYMAPHLIKPQGLNDDRWQPIVNTARGLSFGDVVKKSQSTPPPAVKYASPLQVKEAIAKGNITKDEGKKILQTQFGFK